MLNCVDLHLVEVTSNQRFAVVPQYTMPPRDVFTLHGGVLVDRPLEISEDPYRNMMDRIRHRIEPFTSLFNNPVAVNTDDFASIFEDTDERNSTQGEPTIDSSPIKILVNLLMRSDLLAQTALLQLLLEQRYSVPLIVPRETISMQLAAEKIEGFGHLAEALNFLQVKLENQEVLSLVGDTKLLRVVFVSNRKVADASQTVDMACELLNCEFWSKHKKEAIGDGFTVAELGVGFIKTSKDPLHKHRPCLAFCVWGDHNELEEFLMTIADVVIVELEPKSEEASPPQWPSKKHDDTDILYWNNNSSKRSGKKIATNVSHIWGTFSQMSTAISSYLEGQMNTWRTKGSNGHSATLIDCLHIESIPPLKEVLLKFSEIDAPKYELKRDSFKLQKSFNTEADIYFKSLSDKRTDFSRKMEELKAERKLDACDVLKLPILRDFLQLLSEKDYVKRRIGIMRFEFSIDKQLQPTLEQASKEEGDLFKKHQLYPDDSNLRAQYYSAKKKHVDQMLGLEHVWRELSHSYSAKPLDFKQIPKLAALHLLDGFPLEILDGDANMFQELWVDSVLVNLDTMLEKSLGHKPKIFVLSVVGLQSSGKSTLLNLMFGTQLRTSAGQCTRGVYLQLVKSEWPEFDYVLLLDTEGIRSPGYYGCEDAEIKDNRLATFAVLPADACVLIVANEEDNGLKDVLPMVMLAFKGSAMAEKYAGRMQAKLFFVYRSIDTNDVKNLRKNQQKLQEELREAAAEISHMRISGSTKGKPSLEALDSTSLSINPLSNFKIDEEEEKSDVKYLGNLKKGNVPPLDVPDFDYGERVVELRKYIHKRITEKGEWEAHILQDWSEYLKMVWECIADANFELGFLNRLEYSRYLDLQAKLHPHRQRVGKKRLEEYEELDQKLRGLPKEDLSGAQEKLSENFMKKVDETCVQERRKMDRILEQKQWQRWKVKETERWEDFCLDLKRQSEWLKQDCITGVVNFDHVVSEYCMRIQRAVESKATAYHLSKDKEDNMSREQNIKHDFEKLFQSVIQEATEKYPPLATKVPGMVHDKYQNSPIVGEKYKFVKNNLGIVNHDKPDDSFLSIFKRLFDFLRNKASGTQKEHVQSVTDELIPKIDKFLQYAKQYSDHLVEEVIRLSEETMADHKVENKRDAEYLHNLMKDALSEKLQRIQQNWDRTHNVTKRLEQERSRLQQFFESCAKRVGGTETLTLELSTVLQKALDDSFKDYVCRKVVGKVQGEEWIGNWKVMRAHLDLHLLDLIQAKKTDELISCVTDGGSHYEKVLNGLLEKEILNELKTDLWKAFMTSVKLALQTAAITATTPKSLRILLRTLVAEFSKCKFFELANSVNIVDEESYSNFSNDIDFLEVGKEVFSKINNQKDIASSEVECVVSLVKDRMINSQSEGARPRCEEKCPHCRLTCFLAARHDVLRGHDTLHQPGGLTGRRVADLEDPLNVLNGELVWTSCSRSVSLPGMCFYKSRDSGEWFPCKDFSVHHPTWSPPSESFGVPEVREYIFAHYQEELVQKYKHAKKCTQIPQEYFSHSIPELRTKQENVLQRFKRIEDEADGQR